MGTENGKIVNLAFGELYHIYNHGVGGRDIFIKPENYDYFLALYDKYISPVADTFAWVLMKNHFHFLIQCKHEQEIEKMFSGEKALTVLSGAHSIRPKPETPLDPKLISNQFSKLFNAYAQAFNRYFETRGALFERPFKRKLVSNENYFKQVVVYIHNNPVYHGFCEHPVEYPWSSYLSCISANPSRLEKEKVLEWFKGDSGFKYLHEQKIKVNKIDDRLFF